MAGGDVQEAELVCAGGVIGAGEGDGVSGVFQVHEVDALHGAPVFHVEAGDDARFQHGRSFAAKAGRMQTILKVVEAGKRGGAGLY